MVEQNANMVLPIAERGYGWQTGLTVFSDIAGNLLINEMMRQVCLEEADVYATRIQLKI